MSSSNPPESDQDLRARVSRAEELVKQLIANNEVYHAHKETMANACMAVMLALLGGIVALPDWPKVRWIPAFYVSIPQPWVAFLGIALLWVLIHVFMRWQLRNRRAAAIIQAAALCAQAEWIFHAPSSSDLDRFSPPTQVPPMRASLLNRLARFADWIFPFPHPTLRPDVGKEDYPQWLAIELQKQEAKGSGALIGEWLLTLGSYFVILVIALRTLG